MTRRSLAEPDLVEEVHPQVMPRFMPRFRAADAYEEVWETCEHGPQAVKSQDVV